MRINLRGSWTGLPILLAMGLSGGGVALWRDLRPPQAAVTRDAALQTQWRRIMALRIPGEENPGARIDTQSFSPFYSSVSRFLSFFSFLPLPFLQLHFFSHNCNMEESFCLSH